MANGNHVNHVGGSGNRGFHVYRRFPQLTPAPSAGMQPRFSFALTNAFDSTLYI